jgi:5-methylthioadenosine/S-adenosylhomocysteine deaminase
MHSLGPDPVPAALVGGSLKIEHAAYVLTLDPKRRVIRDGAILVEGGRIAYVGKTAELAHMSADRVIDAAHMVVTPGLINAHHHISAPSLATRNTLPDGKWTLEDSFRLLKAMTEEDEYKAGLLGMAELLMSGTTCFADPGDTIHLDALLQAAERSGIRMVMGRYAVDRPNPFVVPVDVKEAISIQEELFSRYDGHLDGRVRTWVSLFSARTSSRELMLAAKRLGETQRRPVTMHEAASASDVERSTAEHGVRPIAWLDQVGFLGPHVLLAHAIAVDEAEIDILTRTQTKVVSTPMTALRLGRGLSAHGKMPEMLDRGMCVALGADSGDQGQIGILRAMYLMAILFKDARGQVDIISPETALEMATIHGAAALGLDRQVGTIEVGKRADLVLFDTRRPEWRALHDPVSNLVYTADSGSVHTVLVDGHLVVENHRPTFVDQWELIQAVQEVGEQLLGRTAIQCAPRWPIL